ncbi:MAG TPA: YitT family protein, partial [Chitinophagaceae bacterium]|nr:YitT family protein [Chitinophagaceae bacterium]
MNPFATQVVVETATKTSSRKHRYNTARNKYRERVMRTSNIRSVLFLVAGVFSAGFGLKGFLLPSHFIDGGATGISLMLSDLTPLSLSLGLILVNIPFIILGYSQISKLFALRTVFAILGLALVVAVVDYPIVTKDKLLVAAFGGFFLGAGIGLAVRGGGVLDGSEVLAIFISRRTTLSVGDFILIFNIVVFGVASYFLSVEIALYAIITYFVASKTVDFIIEGIEEYTGVTIIS